MNELIMVVIIVGVLAAYALPRISSMVGLQDDAWRDALVSSVRMANKFAVGHRRLVCMTVTNTTVALSVAGANPATACNLNLPGPRGSGNFAAAANARALTTVTPGNNLFFQPDGRVTTDGAGANAVDWTITATGSVPINVFGETGHVD